MLNPPKEFLDQIDYQEDFVELIFVGSIYHHCISWIYKITGNLFEEYFNVHSESDARLNYLVRGSLLEALANAYDHGNRESKTKTIRLGLWLGQGGIIYGISDEGDFFQNAANIKKVESRETIPSTAELSSGLGMEFGVYLVDDIKVQDGILYLLIFAASITEPGDRRRAILAEKVRRELEAGILEINRETGESIDEFLGSLDGWLADILAELVMGEILSALEGFNYLYDDENKDREPLLELTEQIHKICEETIRLILKKK